jgi:hypothetical protein
VSIRSGGGSAATPDDAGPAVPAPDSPDPPAPAEQAGVTAAGSQGVQVGLGGTQIQNNYFTDRGNRILWMVLAVGIVGFVTISAVLVETARHRADGAVPSTTPAPTPAPTLASTPGPTRTGPTWTATIANAPRGIFAYPGPLTAPGHRQHAASLFEGNVVRIVCQEPNGRVITDSTTSAVSTLWYRLDTDLWVSGLYVNLAPGGADRPRVIIPRCG